MDDSLSMEWIGDSHALLAMTRKNIFDYKIKITILTP